MLLKQTILKELIKNGYSDENGSKVWSIANTAFWFITPEISKAFLKLKEVPRYRETLIETEIKLLEENIVSFLESIKSEKFNLIDMNCTDGEKAKRIIKKLPKTIKFRYCPVCVNDCLINLASENIKKENFPHIIGHASRISPNYETMGEVGAALRNSTYQKNAILFLGSLLSSFEINDYLFKLSQTMLPEDLLIIGNGIRTGQRFTNLETYKHPLFNELFMHLMRMLGFKENEVEVGVRFTHNRLEGFYTIKIDKTFQHEEKEINIKKGDKIIVAYQYKLYENELKDFCNMYFDKVELVKDPQNEYALILCKK